MMGDLTSKLKSNKTVETTWETQSRKYTTSNNVNVDFCLIEFSATKNLTWKFHVDDSTTGIYDMILVRYLLTALVLYLKLSENGIHGREGPYKVCSAPMVDVDNYDFNILKAKTFKPEESFINTYVSECFESDSAIRATHIMRRILDAKYEKLDLNKVMTEHF